MCDEIKLSSSDERMIREQEQVMSSLEFQARLARLNQKFERLNHEATLVAKEIGYMMRLCKHKDKVQISPYAKYCPGCGEYVEIKTGFSSETEAWFKMQHEMAAQLNPMLVHKAHGTVVETWM